MVAVIEQKSPSSIEKHHHHHHFFPLLADNIYNCDLCGVRIALLQVENDYQEQFKLCGTCLKEYIDQEAAKMINLKEKGIITENEFQQMKQEGKVNNLA